MKSIDIGIFKLKNPFGEFILCYLLIFLGIKICSAQENKFSFLHLSINNGLSENYVNNIMQDGSGLVWISTANGMNVFDGTNVVKFDRSPYKSILGNGSKASYIDSKNRLWIGLKGLYCINLNTKKNQEYQHEEKDSQSIASNQISKIGEDKHGNIWVGTRAGIGKLEIESGKFSNYYFEKNKDIYEEYDNNRIFDFVFDSKGFAWISTLGGLKKFNQNSNKFEYMELPYGLSQIRIKSICIDRSDNLWINLNDSTLIKYNTLTNIVTNYFTNSAKSCISSNKINKIYCDKSGTIWLGTDNGLNMYEKSHDNFITYKNNYFSNESIADNYITSIFEDRNGLLWIGTASSGVDRMCIKNSSFEHIAYNPYIEGGLKGKNIYRILPDRDKLWLVSSEGVELYDTKSQKIIPKDITHLTNKLNIESIELDKKNILWLGCIEGLFQYDSKTEILKKVNAYKIDNPTQTIFDIKPMEDGRIWLGTSIGLVIYNPKTNKLINRHNDSTLAKLPFLFALKFETYEANNTIISYSNGGILHCDDQANVIKSYNKSISAILENHDYIDVKVDNKKRIYLASNAGLFIINREKIKKYNAESGLPSNRVFSISIDTRNNVWTSSDNGLSKFNLKNKSFTNYTMADGLQSLLFLGRSAAISDNGTLYFGGINGLNVYKALTVVNKIYNAPIRLTGFSCQGKEIYSQSITDSIVELNLGNNQNNISFEFSSLYYQNPAQISYAYMLEGYDYDWNYIGNRKYGSYTNLAPGSYILKIKSGIQNGIWSSQVREIKIIVSAPFWKKNWFSSSLLFGIILILYLAYNYRIRRIKKEEERKTEINKQLSEVKLLALKSQMTPHFIFNSISAIQHFIIDGQNKNALMYLSKFSKLLRIILNNANENRNTIQKEIEFLNLYLDLQSIRFENKFKYEISLEDNYEIETFEIPVLLLQPFVENAIEHGILNKEGEGFIKIKFYKLKNQIVCEVEDNGIGRERAIRIKTAKKNSYKSLGIKISEDRIKTISQLQKSNADIEIIDLYNETSESKGTLVKIILPL